MHVHIIQFNRYIDADSTLHAVVLRADDDDDTEFHNL